MAVPVSSARSSSFQNMGVSNVVGRDAIYDISAVESARERLLTKIVIPL